MPVLTIVIVLIVAGVLLWLVNTYIPMQRTIKNILNAVIVIIIIIWLLKVFGLLNGLQNLRIWFSSSSRVSFMTCKKGYPSQTCEIPFFIPAFSCRISFIIQIFSLLMWIVFLCTKKCQPVNIGYVQNSHFCFLQMKCNCSFRHISVGPDIHYTKYHIQKWYSRWNTIFYQVKLSWNIILGLIRIW